MDAQGIAELLDVTGISDLDVVVQDVKVYVTLTTRPGDREWMALTILRRLRSVEQARLIDHNRGGDKDTISFTWSDVPNAT